MTQSESTRPGEPVHVQAMSTPLVAPLRYSVFTRWRDSWWIGRRDADPGLAHAPHLSEQPSASLRTMDAMFRERCERERLTTVRIAALLIDRRSTLVLSAETLRRQIGEWTEQIESEDTADPGELSRVAKTEAHLDPAQIVARRQREAAARLAPLTAQRSGARRTLVEIERELADIEGRLTTLFEALQARVQVLAHYYERRCNTLVRGYLRRSPGDAEHPLNARIPLRPPGWAVGANPWLREDARAEAAS